MGCNDKENDIKYWRMRGRKILTEDKWEEWDKIVPIRLNDLYEGMELKCCLDLVILVNAKLFDEAKTMIENQGHGAISYGLVCAMVEEFSEYGKEFARCIKYK